MTTSETRPLWQQTLRGFGIFQALAALPTMVILGFFAYNQLFYPWEDYYYFFTSSITALMAAGIIFIVYVQRKAVVTSYQTLLFEGLKSILATGLWFWLIIDSAFGPWRWEHHDHVPDSHASPEEVAKRVKRAALASLLLFVFFYPPFVYAYILWRTQSAHGDMSGSNSGAEEEEPTESAPLLSQQGARTFGRT
ncbi:hypothetical protein FB567DRAFT_605233 [Paraphoma chrysanthemicola]|uniref:Uncharacterized protein n=1 Tax=Paraphoma chrysanthemicola TaxID=798071 RepID=A0A8K0R0H1_9PLEO|nr:hypothetical protein FB567DRAFT_605233 [Paraphoma chrysanthemicola]